MVSGAVVRTAACKKLDQSEALEAVDGSDNQNVKCGWLDLLPFDFPEALQLGGTVYFCCLHKALVYVIQSRYVKHDGLSHGSRKKDQDDTAEGISLISQPVNVLVNQAGCFAYIVKNTIVIIEHPFPYNSNGYRTGYNRKVEDTAENGA